MTASSIGACLRRGLAVWVLIAAAETVHGTMRAIFLAPRVGDLASRQVGVLTGSLMILLIAYLTIDWIGAREARARVAVGTLWLVLMLTFEVALGRALGLSWERIASDYVPSQGGLMIVGMTVLALSPSIAFRWRANARNETHRNTAIILPLQLVRPLTKDLVMTAFRTLLIAMAVVLASYTAIVISNHGLGLLPVFFGDMATMGWPGQFNLDFMFMLALAAIWVAWRHEFSAAGFALGALAFFGGALFLTIYLLIVSMQVQGDVHRMLLGSRRSH